MREFISGEKTRDVEKIQTPLLEKTTRRFENVRLDDHVLISYQHIVELDYRVLKELTRLGLKPENTYIIGKPYSTSPRSLEKYKAAGFWVHPDSENFSVEEPYDAYFKKRLDEFVRDLREKLPSNGRILAWDSGGTLLDAIRTIGLPGHVVGVEHTSSGYNALKDGNLPFPVVNMARSTAKLEVESPFIAEVNVARFLEFLRRHPSRSARTVLILGAGAIGAAVRDKLRDEGFAVTMYDSDPQKSDYHDADVRSVVGSYDVIVGATGTQALLAEDISLLKDEAIVFSVSSSDREFDAAGWRKIAGSPSQTHDDIEVKGRVLLNNGFPLNFYGGEESVLLEEIQLTGAISIASIAYAAQLESGTGFVDLPNDIQEQIVRDFGEVRRSIER